MSLLALVLAATPVCQLNGTAWDPGEAVNAPDGQPLFELSVPFERATARLTAESLEVELENNVVRLAGRLPADATLSVAPRKPIALNAVMTLEPRWGFARTVNGVVLPEELRRPDGSAWGPVALGCSQLALSLGTGDEALDTAMICLDARGVVGLVSFQDGVAWTGPDAGFPGWHNSSATSPSSVRGRSPQTNRGSPRRSRPRPSNTSSRLRHRATPTPRAQGLHHRASPRAPRRAR
jgi:hypothetical protein